MNNMRVFRISYRPWATFVFSLLLVVGFFANAAKSQNKPNAKPGTEFVYVLDSNDMRGDAQVFIINPATSTIENKIKAGYAADFALSPDGSRLYVGSVIDKRGRLDIYEASSGKLQQTVDNGNLGVPTTPRYRSHMTFSADGRWLYIFKYNFREDLYFIAIFDTNAGAFLPESIPLPGCMNAIVSPSSSNKQQLSVMCTSTNDVRFFDISETGNGTVAAKLPLRLRGRTNRAGLSIGFSSLLSTESGEKAILDYGSFFDIDNKSKMINRLGIIDSKSRKGGFDKSPALTGDSEDWMGGKWIPFGAAAVSRNKGTIYLGIALVDDFRRSDWTFTTVGLFDTSTLNRLEVIETKHRLYSIALNPEGDRLFGVDPVNKRLVIFDAKTGNELSVVDQLGESPILVLVGS
jgi:hypothetical protein